MNANTIIFDFDGTIANTFDRLRVIYNQIAPFFRCKQVSKEEQIKLKSCMPQDVMKLCGVTYFKIPFMLVVARRRLLKEIEEVEPIKDMVHALKELKNKGYTLGIMTSNSKKNVSMFLNNNGLKGIFCFISAHRSVFGKDKVIARILRKRNIDKDTAVYIGDEARDVEAAKRLNLMVVAVSWGFSSRESLENLSPDAIIDNPLHLLTFFNKSKPA